LPIRGQALSTSQRLVAHRVAEPEKLGEAHYRYPSASRPSQRVGDVPDIEAAAMNMKGRCWFGLYSVADLRHVSEELVLHHVDEVNINGDGVRVGTAGAERIERLLERAMSGHALSGFQQNLDPMLPA